MKIKHLIKKHLHCGYEALKNTSHFFNHKTVIKLCTKTSHTSLVKLISKTGVKT